MLPEGLNCNLRQGTAAVQLEGQRGLVMEMSQNSGEAADCTYFQCKLRNIVRTYFVERVKKSVEILPGPFLGNELER
jgi:hypothetical protein